MKRAGQYPCSIGLLIAPMIAGHPLWAQQIPSSAPSSAAVTDSAVHQAESTLLQERLTGILVADGFASVAAVVEGERVMVVYENPRYRDPRRALDRAAQLLLAEIPAEQVLILVPTATAVPLLSARYSGRADVTNSLLHPPPIITLGLSDLPPGLWRVPRSSSSFGRIDVVVHPWFEVSFGDFDNPIASRTGIAPEARIALRPGLSLSAQALLTIQDDLPTGESRVRPGLVTINQTMRLSRNVFVSATAGAFTSNRYGVDVETVAYAPSARWSVGAELGLTGATSFAAQGWSFAPMRESTALVSAARFLPRYHLTVRTTAGVFLGGDQGARVDVSRRWGEFELGWFGVVGEHASNGGATVRIPLPQRRYGSPGPLRLRVAEIFQWQYRYRGVVSNGMRYDTGRSLRDFPLDYLATQ